MKVPAIMIGSTAVDEEGYSRWLAQTTCYIDWQCAICGNWDLFSFQFYEVTPL
jgi:hypothetical protein